MANYISKKYSELQPEDGFIKKSKHVSSMIFNYLLIVFCIVKVV